LQQLERYWGLQLDLIIHRMPSQSCIVTLSAQVDWRLMPAGAYGAANPRFVSGLSGLRLMATLFRLPDCCKRCAASTKGRLPSLVCLRPGLSLCDASCMLCSELWSPRVLR